MIEWFGGAATIALGYVLKWVMDRYDRAHARRQSLEDVRRKLAEEVLADVASAVSAVTTLHIWSRNLIDLDPSGPSEVADISRATVLVDLYFPSCDAAIKRHAERVSALQAENEKVVATLADPPTQADVEKVKDLAKTGSKVMLESFRQLQIDLRKKMRNEIALAE